MATRAKKENASRVVAGGVASAVPNRRAAVRPAVMRGSGALDAFRGNTTDVIARMRVGTPARAVPGIAVRFGISQDRLLDLLRLPKSTVKGRISTDGKLSGTEQDRVYRAERVLERAVQVLEDEEAAKAWLTRANRSLGGEVPLALLDTEVGYELVLDTLARIEYGVVS